MSAAPKKRMSEAEYLAFERASETKHEYFNGEIVPYNGEITPPNGVFVAMSGDSEAHSRISVNIVSELRTRLKGRRCRPYNSDMRLYIGETGAYLYPDVHILCGPPQTTDEKQDTVIKPVAVFEVISPSTESHDRIVKFAHYRRLEGLREIFFIAQSEPLVEVYRFQEGHWVLSEYRGLAGDVAVESADCALPLAEIYDAVDFAAAAA